MIERVAVVADPLINGIDSIPHDVGDHQVIPLGPSNDNPNYIIQVGNVFGFIISIENVL